MWRSSKSERLATVYAVVRPILMAIATTPLFPPASRAALRIFITTVDDVTPSLKAGKDLAIADREPRV